MSFDQYKGHKIEKRKDGRYQARFYINKERKTIYGKTKEICYNNLKEALKIKPIKKEVNKIKFYDYFEFWYKTYKEPSCKESHLKNLRSVFKNHIKTNIENKEIDKILVRDINETISKIKGRAKEHTSQLLRQIFQRAFKDKYLKEDISESIIKYNHTREEGSSLTKEQRKILLENCKKIKHGKIFEFYLYSGARENEAINLRPEDIQEDTINIKGTKTLSSNRIIPYFETIKKIFKDIDLTNETIFNISEKTVKREHIKLKELCGFNFKIKDLRTTFGTMCAEMGINEPTIAKWMGHTSTKTTRKYYIKILSEFEKEQAKIFDTHFDT